MSNFTESEVEAAIESNPDFGGWAEFKWSTTGRVLLHVSLHGETLPVTKVDDFGGEGQGDDIWVVIRVGTQLFEKSGYYASHYGSDWEGPFTEVQAVQKTVTVYEAKGA
jgi:hypothetical protein